MSENATMPDITLSDTMSEWLCCLCKTGRTTCKCVQHHKIAGYFLILLAILLGLLNIGIYSFFQTSDQYQDEVFQKMIDLDPY